MTSDRLSWLLLILISNLPQPSIQERISPVSTVNENSESDQKELFDKLAGAAQATGMYTL